jgi:hypothetical protein
MKFKWARMTETEWSPSYEVQLTFSMVPSIQRSKSHSIWSLNTCPNDIWYYLTVYEWFLLDYLVTWPKTIIDVLPVGDNLKISPELVDNPIVYLDNPYFVSIKVWQLYCHPRQSLLFFFYFLNIFTNNEHILYLSNSDKKSKTTTNLTKTKQLPN